MMYARRVGSVVTSKGEGENGEICTNNNQNTGEKNTMKRILVCCIIVSIIAWCTPYKIAQAAQPQSQTRLEVIATASAANTQEFRSAFSGMVLHYRQEVDCPNMTVVKVIATNKAEEAQAMFGIYELSRVVLYTTNGKTFTQIEEDFNRVLAEWFPLTFVEVCGMLEEGAVVMSGQQHYVKFE